MNSRPFLSAGTIGPDDVQHGALYLFANGTPTLKPESRPSASSTGSPATSSSSTSGSSTSNSSSAVASSSSTGSKKDEHPRENRPSILGPAGDSYSSPPQISSISGVTISTNGNSNPMRIAPLAEDPVLSEPTANAPVPSIPFSMGKEEPKISGPSYVRSRKSGEVSVDNAPKIVSEPTANNRKSAASPVLNPIIQSNPMSTGRPEVNEKSNDNDPKLSGDDRKTSKMSTDKENATSKERQVSAASTHASKANGILSNAAPQNSGSATAAATKKSQAQRQLERQEQMKLRKQQSAMRKLQRQQYLKRRKQRKDQETKKQALLSAQQAKCLAVLEKQQANGTLVLATNSKLNEPLKRAGQPTAMAPDSSSPSSYSQKKTVVHQIMPHPPPQSPPQKVNGRVRTKHTSAKKRSSSGSSSTESKSGKYTKSKDTSSDKYSSSGKSSRSSGKDTSSAKN